LLRRLGTSLGRGGGIVSRSFHASALNRESVEIGELTAAPPAPPRTSARALFRGTWGLQKDQHLWDQGNGTLPREGTLPRAKRHLLWIQGTGNVRGRKPRREGIGRRVPHTLRSRSRTHRRLSSRPLPEACAAEQKPTCQSIPIGGSNFGFAGRTTLHRGPRGMGT
jgi:hypothetical protein